MVGEKDCSVEINSSWWAGDQSFNRYVRTIENVLKGNLRRMN
jgi:hypothetical protein